MKGFQKYCLTVLFIGLWPSKTCTMGAPPARGTHLLQIERSSAENTFQEAYDAGLENNLAFMKEPENRYDKLVSSGSSLLVSSY